MKDLIYIDNYQCFICNKELLFLKLQEGKKMSIPKNAKQIDVEGATVPFFKDETAYYFDSSLTGPPEPMVNAMIGLQLLDDDFKLIMINHKAPMGLFPKIQDSFNYGILELANDTVEVTFIKKTNTSVDLKNTDTSCQGTGCSS